MENLNLVLPEIFISLSIMFLLCLGVFKNDSSKITFNISLLVLLITAIITLNETFSIDRVTLFNNSVVIDYMSSLMKIITLLGAFLVLVISSAYLKTFKIYKIEYPVLILSSVLGMMVMISSNDLMVFYMGLELQSLALYVLATFNRNNILSREDYQKKTDELRKKVIDYQSQRRASLDKIATQRADARQKLLKKIDPILNSYIQENNISMVVDKKNVLGGQVDLDITNTIIEKLNKELPSLNLK